MCWQCDNPDKTRADYLEMLQGVIDTHGWAVQAVEKDRWRPGFHYTVGLTPFCIPELLVTGMRQREAMDLLNGAAHHLIHHAAPPFIHGDRDQWEHGVSTEAVDVAEPSIHLVMAYELYGPAVRAVQLVYADDHGRWPWEVGFRGRQSVLGPRALSERAP
ncbi:DUF4262 domain-containing protein [Nocardioides humilatus]|uniref:DUF4262 domain-containing protein n=1 Tax=Nocardioides humilatus TaxID=2607660 RepID=A0A5B1LMK1_9ACTN|nr:DUF4262 domain-containing protein [Nocardioides humilatus]KAA1421763.1 DUF4262 domain-containing protein [Nocardioides humilatus]